VSECVRPEDALTTCAQVCAREGALCEERTELGEGEVGCTRGYAWSLMDDDPGSFTPPCGQQPAGGPRHEPVGCDELIRWDHGTVDNPQTGVKCCCDGDLP
jgi:hypothetical protein